MIDFNSTTKLVTITASSFEFGLMLGAPVVLGFIIGVVCATRWAQASIKRKFNELGARL